MKIAYFDCFSGISGDMTLGALVHLGVPLDYLRGRLAALPLEGLRLDAQMVMRNGIQAVKVNVQGDDQPARDYSHIKRLIEAAALPDKVRSAALGVFERIAAAESRIHGCPREDVHFHEVGGVDAIVDIVGSCLGIDYLGIERVLAAPLPLGRGWVACQHGTLPVPAPATLEILKGLPVYQGAQAQELVTPTGAALVAALAQDVGPLPAMRVEQIGYGAGSRELPQQPNLLRVLVGRAAATEDAGRMEELVVVECAIDDMPPELFGHLMERLFADGALDVIWIPVQMKKNRPGTLVQVLCAPAKREEVTARLFAETTTLGARFFNVRRQALRRRSVTVETPFGPLTAKAVTGLDGRERIVPEYEACRRVARERGIALREVYAAVNKTS